MLLVISLAAVLAFLVLPLVVHGAPGNRPVASLLYFVAIGLGYILVEVTFIQRLVLFLGHPTYALTVVIFLMLLASGAGSMASRRIVADSRRVWMPLILVILALAVYVGILPNLLERFVGAALPAKVAICGMILIPLGFAMGMPFPVGLRTFAETLHGATSNSIEWAWAMNAAASVLGSVLAIVIAIEFGLDTTLACGAGAYLLALLLNGKLRGTSYAG
jgi:hypothetical protein